MKWEKTNFFKKSPFMFVFISLNSFATQGFYSPKNLRLPSRVEKAGNSVVEVLMKVPDRKTKWRALGTGSAFVAGDSQTLWTAAHVVELQSPNLKTGNALTLELYDSLGQKIYDTTNTADTATLELIGDRNEKALPVVGTFESDFARIKLSRPLSMLPIRIHSQKPSYGQKIYSIGFPGIGEIIEATPASILAKIQRSRSTMGEIMNPMKSVIESVERGLATEEASEKSPLKRVEVIERVSKNLIYLDMDGYFGQSGSPIFNEKGQAIGILTGRSVQSDEGQVKTRIVATPFYFILNPPVPSTD